MQDHAGTADAKFNAPRRRGMQTINAES